MVINILIQTNKKYLSFFFQPNKKKNIVRDGLGTTYGRIHMQKQDLDRLQLRKLKAFKKKFDKPDQNNSENENNKKSKIENTDN